MQPVIETTNISVETLWHHFSDRLRSFICSRISDCDTTEDILQEVFIRIHSHINTLRERGKMESWIYQIARNAVIDHHRSHRPVVELDETFVSEEETIEEDNPAARLAPSLREMVESLPEPYREALLLTQYQGLSQKELAERLGISFSGAKSRVQRARHKIRDMLLACCHFEFDRRGAIIDYYERCCCCAGD